MKVMSESFTIHLFLFAVFFFSVRLAGERWLSPLYEKQLPRLATDTALHRCDLYNNGSVSSAHLHLFIVIIIIFFFTLSCEKATRDVVTGTSPRSIATAEI